VDLQLTEEENALLKASDDTSAQFTAASDSVGAAVIGVAASGAMAAAAATGAE
jgi:hypothetical protein